MRHKKLLFVLLKGWKKKKQTTNKPEVMIARVLQNKFMSIWYSFLCILSRCYTIHRRKVRVCLETLPLNILILCNPEMWDVWNRIYITWESMTDSLRIESSVGGSHFCMMGPWHDSTSQLGATVTLGKPKGIRKNHEEFRGLSL